MIIIKGTKKTEYNFDGDNSADNLCGHGAITH